MGFWIPGTSFINFASKFWAMILFTAKISVIVSKFRPSVMQVGSGAVICYKNGIVPWLVWFHAEGQTGFWIWIMFCLSLKSALNIRNKKKRKTWVAQTCPWRLGYRCISSATRNSFRSLPKLPLCSNSCGCSVSSLKRSRSELIEPKLNVKYHIWDGYSTSPRSLIWIWRYL